MAFPKKCQTRAAEGHDVDGCCQDVGVVMVSGTCGVVVVVCVVVGVKWAWRVGSWFLVVWHVVVVVHHVVGGVVVQGLGL